MISFQLKTGKTVLMIKFKVDTSELRDYIIFIFCRNIFAYHYVKLIGCYYIDYVSHLWVRIAQKRFYSVQIFWKMKAYFRKLWTEILRKLLTAKHNVIISLSCMWHQDENYIQRQGTKFQVWICPHKHVWYSYLNIQLLRSLHYIVSHSKGCVPYQGDCIELCPSPYKKCVSS